MNSSKLASAVSIFIVNSSHPSCDDVSAVLKAQIETGERPYIVCLSGENIQEVERPEEILKAFIEKQLEKCEITMRELQKLQDFNQLDDWKQDLATKKGTKKRLSREIKGSSQQALKCDFAKKIIVDFPIENESVKLYVILFDVFDVKLVKSILAFDESIKAIVNLHPRIARDMEVKAENFWRDLMREKGTNVFEKVAFIDVDIPIESPSILNLRRQLIFDQFSHFFYDFELVKSKFWDFNERLAIVDVKIKREIDDLRGLKKRLDEVPESMLTVDVIYDAILAQVTEENESRKSSIQMLHEKPFQIELFGRNFTDKNDGWVAGARESLKFYAESVNKLAESLHYWDDVEKVSLEKRQLLNYFMKKLWKKLEQSEAAENLDIYIYLLQFEVMGRDTQTNQTFYESRSVCKAEEITSSAKKTCSDSFVDYRNNHKIPEEIAQLADDIKAIVDDGDAKLDYLVHSLSPNAMVQRLANLTERHDKFTSQHFELFDVMLVKFEKITPPRMFATKSFKRVLPTPLCFRDFNDFMKDEYQGCKMETLGDVTLDNEHKIPHKIVFTPDDFILPSSIKQRQREVLQEASELRVEEVSIAEQTRTIDESKSEDLLVYDVSSSRIEFHVTESHFNSVHLNANATTFRCLNKEEILNFSCQLEDVLLSLSYDLGTRNLQTVMVADSYGMRYSLEKHACAVGDALHFLQLWNVVLSLPNGIVARNLGNQAIEQCWPKEASQSGENRRVFFSNGFLMIESSNGRKIYSRNGTIYDLSAKSRNSRHARPSLKEEFKEFTRIHQDSIKAINFLQDQDISSFSLTLPNGEVFSVENGAITAKCDTIKSFEKLNKATGYLHIIREDGFRAIHKPDCSKILFPDGTLITTWLRDDSKETYALDDDADMEESILDKIWTNESRNDSTFVVNSIVNRISDYFLKVDCASKFEHTRYAAVYYDGDTSLELFNGTTLQIFASKFQLTCVVDKSGTRLKNSRDATTKSCAILKIDDSRLQIRGEKCSECFCTNEVVMDVSNGSSEGKALMITSDRSGNEFRIKRDGQHAFYSNDNYEVYGLRKCRTCETVKKDFEEKTFGERRVVLNRDYSGFEIFPTVAKCQGEKDSQCFLEGLVKTFDYKFDVEDVTIDFNGRNGASDSMDTQTPSASTLSAQIPTKLSIAPMSSNQTFVGTKASMSSDRASLPSQKLEGSPKSVTSGTNQRKTKKRMSLKGSNSKEEFEIIQPLSEELEMSPNVTAGESIPQDNPIEPKNLIQFYADPLEELPDSIAFGCVMRIDNANCRLVTNALHHLKKYSNEKFVFKSRGLIETAAVKKGFDEKFKLAVEKTIEIYIRERFEFYRKHLVARLIDELLDSATESRVEIKFETESNDKLKRNESVAALAALPIPEKSFSFA